MKFRTTVEPPEPMRGLEIPAAVVEGLGGGKRPRVLVTLNGHSWSTRVAIMRGRHLVGLSNANRKAAGVEVGESVELELALDKEPGEADVPADFEAALAANTIARAAFDALTVSQRRQHLRLIAAAKKPETRARRIESAVAALLAADH
jgi:hypothetical protein